MWNEPTKARLQKIPKLYETEDTPLEEKWIYLHFFLAGCDWFVAEFDGEDLFWGFAILNNDYEMAEWGYISFRELKELETCHGFEVDCELPEYWEVTKARDIEKIRKCMGWRRQTPSDSPKPDERRADTDERLPETFIL
jgi:hypothetical protein